MKKILTFVSCITLAALFSAREKPMQPEVRRIEGLTNGVRTLQGSPEK